MTEQQQAEARREALKAMKERDARYGNLAAWDEDAVGIPEEWYSIPGE